MSFRIPRRDTEIRFVIKFSGNRPLRSCRKVVWFTTKKLALPAGLVPAPILPKMGRSRSKLPERCHPLTCPVSSFSLQRTVAELRSVKVSRIWSGSAAFCRTYSGKIDYRLLAYNNSRHRLFLYIYPAIGGESCTLHDISLFLRTTGLLVWLSLGTEFVIR